MFENKKSEHLLCVPDLPSVVNKLWILYNASAVCDYTDLLYNHLLCFDSEIQCAHLCHRQEKKHSESHQVIIGSTLFCV